MISISPSIEVSPRRPTNTTKPMATSAGVQRRRRANRRPMREKDARAALSTSAMREVCMQAETTYYLYTTNEIWGCPSKNIEVYHTMPTLFMALVGVVKPNPIAFLC
jgi:hypothetical protein